MYRIAKLFNNIIVLYLENSAEEYKMINKLKIAELIILTLATVILLTVFLSSCFTL